MATRVFCDRCDAHCGGSESKAKVAIQKPQGIDHGGLPEKWLDLCLTCASELRRFATERDPRDARAA